MKADSLAELVKMVITLSLASSAADARYFDCVANGYTLTENVVDPEGTLHDDELAFAPIGTDCATPRFFHP